jgi:proteasome lid subunit RPN8/RPN11
MIDHVLVVESEAERLKALAAKRDPFETGGILLGVLSDDVPWVTRVIEVPPVRPHPAKYKLPEGATHSIVAEARLSDPRLGYVGDWHSHPGDIGPSSLDLRSLARLARRAEHRGEPPPVLLIVRKSGADWLITGSRPGSLQIMATPVVLTGAPASQDAAAEEKPGGC